MKQLILLLILISINSSLHAQDLQTQYTDVTLPRMLPVAGGQITLETCPEGIEICPYHNYVEREVTVKSFMMAETEVTFEMYDECVRNGGCQTELSIWSYQNRKVRLPCVEGEACNYPFDEHWGRNSHPVINVSWVDVQKYIKWINSVSLEQYRLPTSQEWEYAARANLHTTFPWGNDVVYGATNCANCGTPWSGTNTLEVARFEPNQFGLYDMHGNVSEWTSNCFSSRAEDNQQCVKYIVRGGAFTWPARHLEPSSAINSLHENKRTRFVGFRLVKDMSE